MTQFAWPSEVVLILRDTLRQVDDVQLFKWRLCRNSCETEVGPFCCGQKKVMQELVPFVVTKGKSCESWSFHCDQRKVMQKLVLFLGPKESHAKLVLFLGPKESHCFVTVGVTWASREDSSIKGRQDGWRSTQVSEVTYMCCPWCDSSVKGELHYCQWTRASLVDASIVSGLKRHRWTRAL